MSKRKLQIQRKAKRIALPSGSQHQELFFFEVEHTDDEIKAVRRVPDWPFDTTDENGSLLSMHGWEVAIHVTWRPSKPDPASELRYKGYLAIMEDIGSRDPKLAAMFKRSSFGFGHPEGATVEFHKPQSDDA